MGAADTTSNIMSVECEVCLKEIPHSEAGVVEANDYVMYWQWRELHEADTDTAT